MDATGPQANIGQPPQRTDSPMQLRALTPDGQVGDAGFPLADPVRVQVLDAQGRPVSGSRVTFTVSEGGGSATPAEAVTDSSGVAATRWQLGPQPGANALRIAAANQSVLLRATATQGRGTALVRLSGGTTDSLPAGCTLATPVAVRVVDANNVPVSGATVSFESVLGDGSLTPTSVVTGPDGVASTRWKLGFQGGASTVRAVLHSSTRATVEFTARSAPAAPNGYSIIGNKIYDPSTCAPIVFHGAARPSLQWWYAGDEHFANIGTELAQMKSWGFNLLRLPTAQSWWVPGTRLYDPGYKGRVVDAVRKARALGMAVIVDLHASDRGDMNYSATPDGQKLPDANISVPFWRDVANTFKDDGGVIFELYNEPHEIDAPMWLNGGDIPTGEDYPGGPVRPGYRAVGMQTLYDVVRSTGARNAVLVSGMHWGYRLNQVPQYAVKGYNIIYASHPYDWPDKQPEVWEQDFGSIADRYPVMLSEFGAYDCTRLWFYNSVLDYADRKGMSWVAWAWWTPPAVSASYTAQQRAADVCRFPALITDWSGTPSQSGTIIRQRLATYRP